jgi:hypothetical protein
VIVIFLHATINKINNDYYYFRFIFFSFVLSSITLYYIKMKKQVKYHDIFFIVVKINHTYFDQKFNMFDMTLT